MYASPVAAHPLDTFQSDAVERPQFHKKLLWALVCSILLHLGVVVWFRGTRLPDFNAPTERLVPRVFKIKDIKIDEKLLDGADQDQPPKKAEKQALKPIDLPDDKPVADVSGGPAAPPAPAPGELVRPLVSDKPTVAPDQTATIQRMQDTAAQAMEQDLNSIKDQLLKEPAGAPKSHLKLPEGGSQADPAHSDAVGLAIASNRLDKLISGGVHRGDAPVTLPGGAVFEFGSAELRPAALDQMHKLGELIQKSPAITFTIEGYTDSFGDAAYNLQLSQQRAESVRSWLVQNMAVDPAHIKAVGFGATRFMAAPKPVDMHSQASIDAEKLHEQPNRRVEIRFH